jgi:predicted FMN-binding regulatory protein PaiB
LVTGVEAVYHTSHIPMIFKRSAEGMFLEGHVARPNQHRSEGDRSGAIAGLLDSGEPANQRVAGVMQSLEEDLKKAP